MVSQVQELVCMAEKQSEEENAIFISKQKRTRVKLLFCCCTRKQGQGSAQVSAEGSCSWLSLILCPVSCSHSQHRCRGWDRLLLDSSPGCHCQVPQRGPEGERLPSGSSVWLIALQGARREARVSHHLQMPFPCLAEPHQPCFTHSCPSRANASPWHSAPPSPSLRQRWPFLPNTTAWFTSGSPATSSTPPASPTTRLGHSSSKSQTPW